jgi:Flp pilus assembly protein protease CpaA
MPVLPDLLALCATWLAAAIDGRTRRIPNWLSASTALGGLGAHAALALGSDANAGAWHELLSALAAGALLLFGFGLLSARGLLGFGDAKLLGGVGLCVGWSLALRVVPCVMLSGGALALLFAARNGELGAVVRNLGRPRVLSARPVDVPAPELHLFPFASAIALGTTWAVAGRYLPAIAPF